MIAKDNQNTEESYEWALSAFWNTTRKKSDSTEHESKIYV